MGRMSARFVALRVGESTEWIYKTWENMGLIEKDGHIGYKLTELGKENGGKMSQNSAVSVPTFDYDTIVALMDEYVFGKD